MRLKNKIASSLGSILEWYDFALYGFFAPIIAELYFPSQNQMAGLLKVFSIYAIGFLARPIGALIFGFISDKYGRVVCLKLTPLLITIPTFIIAILPTYQQIGLSVSFIFLILRIFQGICIGGEYSNNIVYLCETTAPKKVYFLGSIGSCSGSLGIFLASSAATICYSLLPTNILLQWGWRIAFANSLILGIITYLLRRNMPESQIFDLMVANYQKPYNPIQESFLAQKKDYAIACGLIFFPATAFYYVFTFLPNFLNTLKNYNAGTILGDNSLSLFARLFIIPIIGIIAGKIGGIKIARIACLLFIMLRLSYTL